MFVITSLISGSTLSIFEDVGLTKRCPFWGEQGEQIHQSVPVSSHPEISHLLIRCKTGQHFITTTAWLSLTVVKPLLFVGTLYGIFLCRRCTCFLQNISGYQVENKTMQTTPHSTFPLFLPCHDNTNHKIRTRDDL